MKIPKALTAEPVMLLALGIVGVAVAYFVISKAISGFKAAGTATLDAATGAVTGNNAITAGTPYAGAGLVATPAAIADAASGGLLSEFGDWLGGKAADVFQPAPNLNPDNGHAATPQQSVGDNYYDTGAAGDNWGV